MRPVKNGVAMDMQKPGTKSLPVVLPPLDIQAKLVTEEDRLMSEARELEKSLTNSKRAAAALRLSVLAAAFSGKLARDYGAIV